MRINANVLKTSIIISMMILVSLVMTVLLQVNYFSYFFKNIFFYGFQDVIFMLCVMSLLFLLMITTFKVIDIKKKHLNYIVLFLFLVLSLVLTLKPIAPFIPKEMADQMIPGWNMSIPKFFEDLSRSQYSEFLFVGNILIYIPIGYCLSGITNVYEHKKRTLLIVMTFIFYITALELLQFNARLGNFDIGDILLNAVGFVCGMGIYFLVKNRG